MSHQRYAGVPTSDRSTPTAARQPAPELRRALLERALSRRQLLRAMAGATGAALATGVWLPVAAHRGPHGPDSAPRPIPGGLTINDTLIHVNNLGEGRDEATIFDFNGVLGSTFILGQGTAGDGTRYGHFVDMRLMEGVYVGLDGKPHVDTFAFI